MNFKMKDDFLLTVIPRMLKIGAWTEASVEHISFCCKVWSLWLLLLISESLDRETKAVALDI